MSKQNKQPAKTHPRVRNWCFTDFEQLKWKDIFHEQSEKIRYICVGKEICPETKKTHLQGWLQTYKPCRMTQIRKLCKSKKIWVIPCKGNTAQNEKYCKKDGEWETFGEMMSSGKRCDLDEIKKKIMMGTTLKEIQTEHFKTYCRYRGGIEKTLETYNEIHSRKQRKVHVEYIYGSTGTGKTRYAMHDWGKEDMYKIQGGSTKWWNGYTGQKTIVIDEYNNNMIITDLLALLDDYQLRLEIKGGHTYAMWNKVYITSNLTPDQLHESAKEVHREALFRRINVIKEMTMDMRVADEEKNKM